MSLPTLLLIGLTPLLAPRALQEIPEDTDIQTTESGLQYSVLTPGEGERPGVGDRVLVHYTGWLGDGTLIVSSRTNGKAIEVGVGQQKIAGLNEGLQLVRPGGRVKLTIPPELGYGDRGRGKHIPPGATLIYDVELLAITARVPEFVPLAADCEETPSGLRVEWLQQTGGKKRGENTSVWVEYTYWDALGECHFSTSMTPNPVILRPRTEPFKFFGEVFALLGEGDEALFEVPPAQLFGDRASGKLPPNSVTIWRVRIVRVFEKPTFPTVDESKYTRTPAGLLYRIVREGHGRSPAPDSRVRLHYTGWRLDGVEVATSYDKTHQPTTVSLSEVIPGLGKAIQFGKEGGVVEVVVPGYLAYREQGRKPLIPPDATLVYVAELVQVY